MYPNYENNFNHESDPNFTQPESGAPQRPTEFIDIKPAKPKRQRRFAKTLAACLCCAVIGGVAGGAGVKLADGMGGAAPVSTVYEGSRPTVISTAAVDSKSILSATEVYNANLPSVVGINGNVTTNIWGQTVKNAVSGSGFVISSDGYIITNYHVINGVSDISVFFSDGTSYDAQVVGGEEDNDIAVLKIDAQNLRPVVLGDSNAIQIGEHVYAVGNPLGELTFTLTGGYVSAKDREITTSGGTVMNMIQTDAAINSGNSGGPLFDQYGQVVGIVSAKFSGSSNASSTVEGLGFAIPLNDVKGMVTSIIQNGYVTGKPHLGLITESSTAASAWMQSNAVTGCRVLAVLENSCSDAAGLQAGDVITKAGETAITSSGDLSSALQSYEAGDTLTLTISRSGQEQTVTVTLDEEDLQRRTDMETLQKEYQASLPAIPYYGFPYGG